MKYIILIVLLSSCAHKIIIPNDCIIKHESVNEHLIKELHCKDKIFIIND
jgi:hypothetical protein